ncbi:MAG TPA: CcdB family protein [Polaromonas sp.]|jgi:toxin CcdB|uniref:CcdB family protein n=1 Tax=unclassified Polaromonas TaxID=2638319 RepID=UPI0025D005B1|nr:MULTISPECIES: CcdB family protein [unclassified Polaromonas]HQR99403.1 CcdB family protein [Polaromonas sp.]HQS87777.1 CcdB family protein [Polaromonas sp.]HQT07033.1 CcdB family protein [Polaromonas sp.]
MAQFDVYPHPVEEWRDQSPYVVDIQSDLVRGVRNRLTIPLTHVWVESPTERLAPVVQVEGVALFLDTLGLLAFPSADLRGEVTSLRSEAPRIWSALDCALHGY